MKKNIDRTLRVKNIIVNNTNMKTYLKYLCAVLIALATHAHAWATTETLNFAKCDWAFSTSAYEFGYYSADGYTVYAEDVKENYYESVYYSIMLEKNTSAFIQLPTMPGVVSRIDVVASTRASTEANISLYVNGVQQGSAKNIGQGSVYWTGTWAAGSVIKLQNDDKGSGKVTHIASVTITHNGSQVGGSSVPIGEYEINTSAAVPGTGTATANVSTSAAYEVISLTATPASGYAFDYWEVYYTNDCSTPTSLSWEWIGSYSSASTSFYMPYGKVTAVAYFVESLCEEHTVSLTSSGSVTGGTFSASPSSACADVTISLSATPASGYEFGSWTVNKSGGGTCTVTNNQFTMPDVNVTVNATFNPRNYTIMLDNQSATSAGSANISVTYNATTNLTGTPAITVPSKTGYTFGGYYTAVAGGGTQVIAANGNVNASVTGYTSATKQWIYAGSVTLYAKWTQTVTLDNESPTSAGSTSVTLTYNSTSHAAITNPTKTGYVFSGWWSEDNGTGVEIINSSGTLQANKLGYTGAGGVWVKDGATTLYAKWAPQRTLAVDNVDDVVISVTSPSSVAEGSSTSVAVGATVTLTHGAVTSPYTWAGWNVYKTGDESTKVTVTSNSFTMPDYNVTVSAFIYGDFVAFCDVPEITLVTSDGDPALVTSRNGVNIMAVKTMMLNITNVSSGKSVTISGTGLHFYTDDGTRFTEASLTTPVSNQVLRVSYNPTTDGDGSITEPRITVSVAGTEVNFDGKIKARNLPAKVALVAKAGNTWMALPTPKAESNPSGILVTVSNGVAYGPDSASYKLWPVRTVNSSYDRFGTASSAAPNAQYGDRLRFAAYCNGNKGLWANNATDGTGISTANAIATLGAAGNAPNEWKVETRIVDGQFVYKLQTQQSKNTKYLRYWLAAAGGPKWGTYASGIQDIYILPLTEITKADIVPMEWGTNSIAVKYTNRGNCTGMTTKIGSEDAVTATITAVGGDIYKISTSTASDLDLQSNPGQTLTFTVVESGSPKQAMLQIPYIITDEDGVAEATIRGALGDAAQLTDVVVRDGGKLTTGTASGDFKDLYIYPSGKAEISRNIGLKNIYLRGGFSWLGGDYAHPQMNVTSGVSISGIGTTGNGVFYDLYLNSDMYYMFALPKTVAVTAITNEENGDDWDAWIKSYSGEGRTLSTKVSGWSYVTSGNIERGVGYEIAIAPRNSRPYGILRFPLLKSAAWSDEGTPFEKSVTGWGLTAGELNEGVTANNAGWNYIGNPFMTAYHNTAVLGPTMQTKTLVKHIEGGNWDGTWDWSTNTVKYLTIPRYTEYEYDDVRALNTKLDAFFPFFIQVTGDGTVSMGASNKTLKAPAHFTTTPEREVVVDFALQNSADVTDEAGLNISNQYSAAFDMDDKEKTIQNGLGTMKVYTLVGDHRTAYNSLPEATAALPVPVGYIAPTAGTYKFKLVDGADYSEVEHLWLTDYVGSNTVDLLTGTPYEFETEAGEFKERFAIYVILKPEENTATDLEDLEDATQPMKFIYRDQLYILRGGVIYDATGRRVSEINK